MKEIDAKGLACPAPVIQTKAVVESEQPENILVIVDNDAARQNVTRFLESRHYNVSAEKKDDDFHITGKLASDTPTCEVMTDINDTDPVKIMILAATDRMGYGDDALGKNLVINFIKTLKEMEKDLWRLVFINNGVKLTVQDSPVLEDLKHLEANGVHILVCGTCLTHFNLLDKKKVGETTNMLDVVTSMQLADKVINI